MINSQKVLFGASPAGLYCHLINLKFNSMHIFDDLHISGFKIMSEYMILYRI